MTGVRAEVIRYSTMTGIRKVSVRFSRAMLVYSAVFSVDEWEALRFACAADVRDEIARQAAWVDSFVKEFPEVLWGPIKPVPEADTWVHFDWSAVDLEGIDCFHVEEQRIAMRRKK